MKSMKIISWPRPTRSALTITVLSLATGKKRARSLPDFSRAKKNRRSKPVFFMQGLLDQAEEFAAGRGVFAELTEHHRGDHRRILFFHTAHHHAHVLGFDHHRHAQGAGHLLDRVGDLRSEEHTSDLQSLMRISY